MKNYIPVFKNGVPGMCRIITIRTPLYKIRWLFLLTALFVCIHLTSCREDKPRRSPINLVYETFRDSVMAENKMTAPDTTNLFDDSTYFIPQQDSVNNLLVDIVTMLHRQAFLMEQMDTLIRRLKISEGASPEEKEILKENIRMLDSFLTAGKPVVTNPCREKECYLYAEVIKSRQLLYLHLGGELKDSFAVSTGVKKYRTPNLNVRPSGPVFTKYTSRKFPGGNYKGLGNMPYAVFVKGGYAILGTTHGNIPLLGTEASHGCIRLHPDNARVFYKLVKLVGLSETWVNNRDFD
jgi:hypothetical protein